VLSQDCYAYGRCRIIGDYRRVALYGISFLIQEKENDLKNLLERQMTEENIRIREETHEQIQALNELAAFGDLYGFNLRLPATNAKEAIQWTYLAFLASIRETNGAANSIGRLNTFFDIYIERDLAEGTLIESTAQELIDQFVIKLRLIRTCVHPSIMSSLRVIRYGSPNPWPEWPMTEGIWSPKRL
jgi:formate C-acetyltransferase